MSGRDERPIRLKEEICLEGCVYCKHLKYIERYNYCDTDAVCIMAGHICTKIREFDDMED